jgi:hypothetical protein
MAANWSRVWRSEGSGCGSSMGTGACASSCYNFVGNQNDPTKSILNDFPLGVGTVAEAMQLFANSLATRLGASDPVSRSSSDMDAAITMRLSRRADDTVKLQLRMAPYGNYPVSCTYTYGVGTGTGSFGSLGSLQDWLVAELRK